jgi:hypothetical protein
VKQNVNSNFQPSSTSVFFVFWKAGRIKVVNSLNICQNRNFAVPYLLAQVLHPPQKFEQFYSLLYERDSREREVTTQRNNDHFDQHSFQGRENKPTIKKQPTWIIVLRLVHVGSACGCNPATSENSSWYEIQHDTSGLHV